MGIVQPIIEMVRHSIPLAHKMNVVDECKIQRLPPSCRKLPSQLASHSPLYIAANRDLLKIPSAKCTAVTHLTCHQFSRHTGTLSLPHYASSKLINISLFLHLAESKVRNHPSRQHCADTLTQRTAAIQKQQFTIISSEAIRYRK